MSKDNKNKEKFIFTVLKTLVIMLLITLLTYSVMSVITHFSLFYGIKDYSFKQSVNYIFNTNSSIFMFFSRFLIINILWISIAVFINYIKKLL